MCPVLISSRLVCLAFDVRRRQYLFKLCGCKVGSGLNGGSQSQDTDNEEYACSFIRHTALLLHLTVLGSNAIVLAATLFNGALTRMRVSLHCRVGWKQCANSAILVVAAIQHASLVQRHGCLVKGRSDHSRLLRTLDSTGHG